MASELQARASSPRPAQAKPPKAQAEPSCLIGYCGPGLYFGIYQAGGLSRQSTMFDQQSSAPKSLDYIHYIFPELHLEL
jgi:hypothetical protein